MALPVIGTDHIRGSALLPYVIRRPFLGCGQLSGTALKIID